MTFEWLYDETKKKPYIVGPNGRRIYSKDHVRFLEIVMATEPGHGFSEFVFDEQRKWAFDWAWPDIKVAAEYEGNVYGSGKGHRSTGKFSKDMEKYNHAAIQGWCVLRCGSVEVRSGTFEGQLFEAIQRRSEGIEGDGASV